MATTTASDGTNSVGNQFFGITPVPAKQGFDMNTFLRLLTSELQNQDPTSPMSNSEFASQMAQLGSVTGMDNLQKSAKVQEAASLMGKHVTAVRPLGGGSMHNTMVDGMVTGLTVKNGVYYLSVTEPDGGQVDIQSSGIKTINMF